MRLKKLQKEYAQLRTDAGIVHLALTAALVKLDANNKLTAGQVIELVPCFIGDALGFSKAGLVFIVTLNMATRQLTITVVDVKGKN